MVVGFVFKIHQPYVKEIYHPDYVAKRMEIGAVMGAAPRKDVIRETSDPGDRIVLLGFSFLKFTSHSSVSPSTSTGTTMEQALISSDSS